MLLGRNICIKCFMLFLNKILFLVIIEDLILNGCCIIDFVIVFVVRDRYFLYVVLIF